MKIDISTISDFDSWLNLAKEVEPLFGPMSQEVGFHEALKIAISDNTAFCIHPDSKENNIHLKGGIIISKESNEIAWLAVSKKYRGHGYGRELLKYAINNLDSNKDIFVQTFDDSVSEGNAARKLYTDFGFTDFKDGGPNPAGIPTTIMKLSVSQIAF